jgi:hypothetical protein
MAMLCSALFAARPPPRFARCSATFPEEAGTRLTWHNVTKLPLDWMASESPTAVSSDCAGDSCPIAFRVASDDGSSSTIVPTIASRVAISSWRSRYRRRSDLSAIR